MEYLRSKVERRGIHSQDRSTPGGGMAPRGQGRSEGVHMQRLRESQCTSKSAGRLVSGRRAISFCLCRSEACARDQILTDAGPPADLHPQIKYLWGCPQCSKCIAESCGGWLKGLRKDLLGALRGVSPHGAAGRNTAARSVPCAGSCDRDASNGVTASRRLSSARR